MIKAKKIIAIFFCLALCVFCCPAAFAAEDNSPIISLSQKTASPEDSVTIDINISDNPGIMAMAFCITYDTDALEYTGYTKGYLSDYTLKNHTDKGHISFVNVENRDISTNGTILSVNFNVKSDAPAGKHTITLANSNRNKHGYSLHNSFSDSKQNFIVPTVISGSVTVSETCANSPHIYGDWTTITPADCTNTGLKSHTCSRCGYQEEVEIPITHDFEDEWTVDRVATKEQDGIMSRHCKKCDAVTDTVTFKYEEVEDSENNGDNNTSSNTDNSSISNNNTANNNNSQSSNIATDSSNTDSSNKTTVINNTLGAKNPLSAVENLKDYQENIKPYLESSSESTGNSDTESPNISDTDNTSNNESEAIDADNDSTQADDNLTQKNESSTKDWLVPTIVSIAIIAIVASVLIVLIISNKRKM